MLSLYIGELREEEADRFHANIAFAREAFDAAGGWPLTKRGDFDQQLLVRLSRSSATVDPCRTHPPSYVFRWGSTGAYHGQSLMRGAEDESWYASVAETEFGAAPARSLAPRLDLESGSALHANLHV